MLELLRIRPRVVRPPIPVSEVGAGGQGVRVPQTEDPLIRGQQRGVLAVSLRAVRLMPRSRSLTDRGVSGHAVCT